MKMSFWLITLFIFTACIQPTDQIEGNWKVNSAFYSADYKIIKERGKLSGLVLYYYDGTTKYKHDGSTNYYYFTGLKKQQNNSYIDGVSSATSKVETLKNIQIKYKHKDTLEVTTHLLNQPIVEIWTRNKSDEKENN